MMRRALHDITGMRIHATDGDLGHVRDIYFDDGPLTQHELDRLAGTNR